MKKLKRLLGAALAVTFLFTTSCNLTTNNDSKDNNTEVSNDENTSKKDKETEDNSSEDKDKDDDNKSDGSDDTESEAGDDTDDGDAGSTDEDGDEDDDGSSSTGSGTKTLDGSLSSVNFAKNLVIGWNLGNTLDAPTETGWGMPTTTKEMIDAVKAAGFKTIRIPVSWSTHVSTDGKYTIDSTWMARVKEIVDWAISDDMYVILNVHHDNYFAGNTFVNEAGKTIEGITSNAGFALSEAEDIQTKSKAYLKAVWTQIATTFNNDYDEKLIFEVLNEPRAVGESVEWNISDSSTAKSYCDVITAYEETCISAIRATGGNNAKRYLMVPGYAASGTSQTMLSAYTLPSDTAEDKLILSTHAYSPYNFAMANSDSEFGTDDESSLTSIFNYLKTNYTDKGIGVVMGEASASNKNNTDERIKWANDYFAKAKAAGIPVVLWDNMVADADGNEDTTEYPTGYNGEHHGWLNRNACKWYFPTIIKAMMDTVGVTEYSIPEYVEPTVSTIGWNDSKATTISSTSTELSWTTNYKLAKSNFADAKEGSILKLTFTAKKAAIKIINSSWATYSSGTIINGTADSDGVITASATELYYVLTAADATAWKSNDIYIAGQNGTITKTEFQASTN